MTLTQDNDFAGLEDDSFMNKGATADPDAPAKPDRPTFPCEHCDGTGEFRGVRIHQEKEHCFACKGRGFFYKSKFDREKAREKSRARQAKKDAEKGQQIAGMVEQFRADHPGLLEFLQDAAGWSPFAGSMIEGLLKFGGLTEKQLAAAVSMRTKSAERDAARAAEREAKAKAEAETVPTLATIAQAFLTAAAELKFPKLRMVTADGLNVVLTRCGDRSRTPGHINVTDGGPYGQNTYYGRITPDGRALFKDAPESVIAVLMEFNADPAAAFKVQGQRTGCCCICNRTLVDPESVARGVGPICAGRYGF